MLPPAICFLVIFGLNIISFTPTNAQTRSLPDTSGNRSINLGFHKLFISEKGNRNAAYTIVFQSGGGGSSQDWMKVISKLPAHFHTIAYDRASLGKSEAGPIPRTMSQEVFELNQLLQLANIKGPVILVGHSIGGLLVRLYTERYGKQVKGLVLVDPTHESSMLGSFKYGGWVRLREKATGKLIPGPQLVNKVSAGYDSTTDYMAEEFQQLYVKGLKKKQALGNRPLIIIAAGIRKQPPGTPDEQWQQLKLERDQQLRSLTSLSGNSKFLLDPASSHYIQNDNPDLVAKCIQMVIDAVTAKAPLQ